MTNKTIDQLPAATSLTGGELLMISQTSVTRSVPVSTMLGLVPAASLDSGGDVIVSVGGTLTLQSPALVLGQGGGTINQNCIQQVVAAWTYENLDSYPKLAGWILYYNSGDGAPRMVYGDAVGKAWRYADGTQVTAA